MAGREEFHVNGNKVTRRVERHHRIRLLNIILAYYDLKVVDWGGSSYIISNITTGASEEIYQLNNIWRIAEELSGMACDPLDADLIHKLIDVNSF